MDRCIFPSDPMVLASTLFSPKVSLVSAGISSFLGFTFSQAFGNNQQLLVTVVSTVIAGALGAILTTIPRLITAKSNSRKADFEMKEASTSNLIRRLTEVCEKEKDMMQERISEKDLISILERNAKRVIFTECQRAHSHIEVLRLLLRGKDITCPNFEFRSYDELVGESDRHVEAIATARVAYSQKISDRSPDLL